jgi:hypothetical protein
MYLTVPLDNFHVKAFPSSTIRTLNPQLPSYFILCGYVGNTGRSSKCVCGQDINRKCFKMRWKGGWGSKLRWFGRAGIEAWRVENLWKVDHMIRVEREVSVRDFLMRFTLNPNLSFSICTLLLGALLSAINSVDSLEGESRSMLSNVTVHRLTVVPHSLFQFICLETHIT